MLEGVERYKFIDRYINEYTFLDYLNDKEIIAFDIKSDSCYNFIIKDVEKLFKYWFVFLVLFETTQIFCYSKTNKWIIFIRANILVSFVFKNFTFTTF
jgi:hypothetical protein